MNNGVLDKNVVILDLGNCAVGLQCGFARFVLLSCVFGWNMWREKSWSLLGWLSLGIEGVTWVRAIFPNWALTMKDAMAYLGGGGAVKDLQSIVQIALSAEKVHFVRNVLWTTLDLQGFLEQALLVARKSWDRAKPDFYISGTPRNILKSQSGIFGHLVSSHFGQVHAPWLIAVLILFDVLRW